MFVDTSVRPQGEQVDAVAPAKLKLSQAIRIGCEMTEAGILYTYDGKCCVVGAGLLGYLRDFGKIRKAANSDLSLQPHVHALSEMSKVPFELVQEAEWRYMSGQSRESIADWLEAQGL